MLTPAGHGSLVHVADSDKVVAALVASQTGARPSNGSRNGSQNGYDGGRRGFGGGYGGGYGGGLSVGHASHNGRNNGYTGYNGYNGDGSAHAGEMGDGDLVCSLPMAAKRLGWQTRDVVQDLRRLQINGVLSYALSSPAIVVKVSLVRTCCVGIPRMTWVLSLLQPFLKNSND